MKLKNINEFIKTNTALDTCLIKITSDCIGTKYVDMAVEIDEIENDKRCLSYTIWNPMPVNDCKEILLKDWCGEIPGYYCGNMCVDENSIDLSDEDLNEAILNYTESEIKAVIEIDKKNDSEISAELFNILDDGCYILCIK